VYLIITISVVRNKHEQIIITITEHQIFMTIWTNINHTSSGFKHPANSQTCILKEVTYEKNKKWSFKRGDLLKEVQLI